MRNEACGWTGSRWAFGIGVAVLSMLLSGCGGIEVETHPAADFAPANYRALAWASPPLDARSGDDLRALERSVRKAVGKGLAARGYTLAAAGADPDLLIDYRWSRRIEPRGAGAVSPGDEMARMVDMDPTPAGGGAIHRHPVVDVAERIALHVSLRDAATRRLVWWGSAETVAPGDGEKVAPALIDRLVERLLRELSAR